MSGMSEFLTSGKVYDWFREALEERKRLYQTNIIHVSEAAGCLRKAFFERTTPLKPTDASVIMMMVGNGVHNTLQDILSKKGWIIEKEVTMEFKTKMGMFKLTGHADLWHPEKKIVLELKTTGNIPEKPFDNHILQLNAYHHMLNAKQSYIIYIQRDKGLVKVFQHKYSEELWRLLVKRAYYLYYSLKDNKPPKTERGPICEYCPYKWRCYQEANY